MIRQSPAKIFLADQRAMNETRSFRSFQLLDSKTGYDPGKQHFGELVSFNDTLLAPGQSLQVSPAHAGTLILLPLYGAVEWKTECSEPLLLAASQVLNIQVQDGKTFHLKNPFKDTVVNYLDIRLDNQSDAKTDHTLVEMDLNTFMNVMVQVLAGDQLSGEYWRISLGKFSGRGETVYERRDPENGIFVFVIEGAFEVEGRLLHSRDGLALWDTDTAEIEALSNDAILLILENRF